ncbi:MAG: YncE family protein [Chloroflexi bacterium]|nr:YncE family protein [Chloroflexota bacterium]
MRGTDYICPVPECQFSIPITGCIPRAGAIDPTTGYAYFACEDSSSVAVVSNTTVIANVLVGAKPNALTYSDLNRYVYVVNSGETPATVSVISVTQVIATIPVGISSTGLGTDFTWGTEQDGSTDIIRAGPTGYVYVANWGSNSVSVLRGTQKITDLAVGTHPNSIAIDPVNDYVYVANVGSDNVSVLTATQVVDTVGVGDSPFGLAVNADSGYAYVVNRDDSSVSVLRFGRLVRTIGLPLHHRWLPVIVK